MGILGRFSTILQGRQLFRLPVCLLAHQVNSGKNSFLDRTPFQKGG